MNNQQDIKLRGKFFFKRLKKGDPGYYRRLNDRYQNIRKSAVRYVSMTEQELFYSYIELMDTVIEIQKEASLNNGS